MSKYKKLAQQLISEIESGCITVGDKLLSVRAFSKQHDVSVTTALNCYEFLLSKGYAVTRPRSGYFAQSPVTQVPPTPLVQFCGSPSVTTQVDLQYTQHPFSTAQLAQQHLPVTELNRGFKQVYQMHGGEMLSYGDASGTHQLRSTLAAWYSQRGFRFTSDELIIGHGCIDSVRVALEVSTQPGDTVIVASPCFSGLLDMLNLLNRQILEIPSQHEGIDLEQLEDIIREKRASALLITANFQNPLGQCFSNSHKAALAKLANQYQFPIIEDDVYHETSFDGVLPLPIKYWDTLGDVLWCSSFSKTLCAGYRIGWCLPGKYHAAYTARRRVESLGVNIPAQLVLAEFVATGGYQKHLKRLTLTLQKQMHEYREILANEIRGDLAISNPSGGMVLWCRVNGLNSELLCSNLYKDQIGLRPGSIFSTRHFYQEYFRINCGWPLDNLLKNQLSQVTHHINLLVV